MDFGNKGDGDYVGRGSGDSGQWMWAILIFVIFALLLMWGRKDRNECDTMLPLLAASGSLGGGKRDECERIWDVERDMMNQFSQTRMEAKDNAWTMSRDADRYFYEQQKTSLVGFKDSEIQGLHNTSKIESRIDALERTFKEDIIRKQGEELNFYKTVQAVRGWGIPPSQPMYTAPYQYNGPCPQYA